ncbi:hypothetical protein [Streptomyces sp. NPDC057748]|uniref:hypothetical protein n=1 Tax=unclassified Streptomyces TaxID=2593676 RepID=UPI0036BFB5B9
MQVEHVAQVGGEAGFDRAGFVEESVECVVSRVVFDRDEELHDSLRPTRCRCAREQRPESRRERGNGTEQFFLFACCVVPGKPSVVGRLLDHLSDAQGAAHGKDVVEIPVPENGLPILEPGEKPQSQEGQVRLVEIGGRLKFAQAGQGDSTVAGSDGVSEVVEDLDGGSRGVELRGRPAVEEFTEHQQGVAYLAAGQRLGLVVAAVDVRVTEPSAARASVPASWTSTVPWPPHALGAAGSSG